jgi:hypothetical protein
LTLDTKVTTIEQAQEKLKQAIDLGVHDDADYWRDWIKEQAVGARKVATSQGKQKSLSLTAMALSRRFTASR